MVVEPSELGTKEGVMALILELQNAAVRPSASLVKLSGTKGSNPKLVCLDFKDWINLSQAHYGKSTKHAEALRTLKGAVADERIVLPITSVNVIEAHAIANDEQRKRLARVMVDLSRNHSLVDHVAIRKREMFDALVTVYKGGSSIAPRADMVRWGISNAAGLERGQAVGAPPQLQALLDEVTMHPLSSERALGEIHSDEATRAGYEMDERWCEAVEQVRHETAHLSAREQLAFETMYTLREGHTGEELRSVAEALGVARAQLAAWLELSSNRVALIERVPSLMVSFTLRHSRDPDPQHRMKRNDLRDLLYLSSTIPYADFVVTDRAWADAVARTGVGRQYGTAVCRDLTALVSALEGE